MMHVRLLRLATLTALALVPAAGTAGPRPRAGAQAANAPAARVAAIALANEAPAEEPAEPGTAELLHGPPPLAERPLRRRDVSWIHIDRPRPKRVGVHDIVTVIVDEKSEVTQNSRFNRQRNLLFKAQLKEFIRLNEDFILKNAAQNSPTIDAQLRSQLQSFGQGLSQEGMKYRIAATVVDVLPNGTLILEAHKSIRTNGELWEYSLTGRIRTQDIQANNTVQSENVADLSITKREHGKIHDSTKRGAFMALYDFLLPF
jgi:flagellar L-ring protein precursor FlgH